jgi:hypothetical protein
MHGLMKQTARGTCGQGNSLVDVYIIPLEAPLRREAFMALLAAVGAALIVGAAVPLDPLDIDIDMDRDLDIFKSRASNADTEVDKAAITTRMRRANKLEEVMVGVMSLCWMLLVVNVLHEA